MTIQEAQSTVDNWIKTVGVRYFNELTNMALLSEEVGELASCMVIFLAIFIRDKLMYYKTKNLIIYKVISHFQIYFSVLKKNSN